MLNISEQSTSASTSRKELDSHDDSPIVGKNAMILYKTEMTVNVNRFSDDFGMMPEVPFSMQRLHMIVSSLEIQQY